MDTLEETIASILIDVIKAQNRANEFSARLAEVYRDPELFNQNPNLGVFPVPNSLLKALEVKLTFAVDDERNGTGSRWQAGLRHAIEDLFGLEVRDASSTAEGLTRDALESVIARATEAYAALSGIGNKSRPERIAALAEMILADIRKTVPWRGEAGEEEKLARSLESSLPSPMDEGTPPEGLPISFRMSTLKEGSNGLLGSVTLQIDLRSYQVGFEEAAATESGSQPAKSHLIPFG